MFYVSMETAHFVAQPWNENNRNDLEGGYAKLTVASLQTAHLTTWRCCRPSRLITPWQTLQLIWVIMAEGKTSEYAGGLSSTGTEVVKSKERERLSGIISADREKGARQSYKNCPLSLETQLWESYSVVLPLQFYTTFTRTFKQR